MAIYHLSTTPISRRDGRSAVAAAAYRAGAELADARTGQVFDYTRKGGVLSAEMVAPDGHEVPDREALWNAAEAAEKRKDARVAREWRAALPAELTEQERASLAKEFGQYVANRYGVAVDVCVHAPDKGGDERNYHVHMLATTRQIEADGTLGKKASFELGNKDRQKAGITTTTQQELVEIRGHWAELTNAALERAGHAVRVDHRSYEAQGIDITPTKHIGVAGVAMDRKNLAADRVAVHEETRAENAAKIEERPTLILEKITQTQAVFDRRDIARELNRYIDDPQQFQNLMARIESAPELVQLAPEQKAGRRTIPEKLTTRDMIDAERGMIASAEQLTEADSHAVNVATITDTVSRYETLSDEQRAAVEHVTGAGRLAVIVGDAGTGKSFAMRVAKEAWEAEGYRVMGCALAGKAADELQAGSGIESRTIHSLEAGWDREAMQRQAVSRGGGRSSWKNNRGGLTLTSRDVLVIDEAGMVGSRQLGRVLAAAEKAGAKVVMLGDDKQLAAIEAGAGFRAITERVGAAEITQIRRQSEQWARDASSEFARGDVRAGMDAYAERGHVKIEADRDTAKSRLAADWLADQEKGGSSIVLAHTNADVRDLNDAIRVARKQAGELDHAAGFETERGAREFAAGDRIVFLKNDRELGVKNGTLGTVEQAEDGRLAVRLDDGKDVAFSAEQFGHVDHGYAVTVHKAQGVTVDRAYVLATGGMDRNLAYVGMTRHRDTATLYAGSDDFGSYDKLARSLARQRPKESTLDFPAGLHGFAERRDFDGLAVVQRWAERGREQLASLAGRAEKALGRVLEAAGVRRDVPGMESAGPAQIEALRAPEKAQDRPQGQDDRQAKILGQLRHEVATARQSGDEAGAVVAGGKLRKAEDLDRAGKPLSHHAIDIAKAGRAALQEWGEAQQRGNAPAPAKPELSPAAAAALEKIRAQRARERGEQERPGVARQQDQAKPELSPKEAALERIRRARNRERGRGGHEL